MPKISPEDRRIIENAINAKNLQVKNLSHLEVKTNYHGMHGDVGEPSNPPKKKL